MLTISRADAGMRRVVFADDGFALPTKEPIRRRTRLAEKSGRVHRRTIDSLADRRREPLIGSKGVTVRPPATLEAYIPAYRLISGSSLRSSPRHSPPSLLASFRRYVMRVTTARLNCYRATFNSLGLYPLGQPENPRGYLDLQENSSAHGTWW